MNTPGPKLHKNSPNWPSESQPFTTHRKTMNSSVAPSARLTKAGNKKRVRRIDVELSSYRRQVQELGLKLKRLKMQRSQSGGDQITHKYQNCETVESQKVSVWNGIAERQFKERLRAADQQKQIRETQTQATTFSTQLMTLLEKCCSQEQELLETLTVKQLKFWELAQAAEHDLFAEQLAIVARLRLQLQQGQRQAPNRTISFDWGAFMGNLAVKRNESSNDGVALEVHCGTTVPFNLEVTAQAYRRFIYLEHGDMPSSDAVTKLSTGTISRSFSLRLTFEGLIIQASGKYTCRQYVTKDEIMIVWVEHADISDFGGIKFQGMQYQKRACLKLRRVPHEGPGAQSTSTVVEKYVETIPIFRESAVDTVQQTQAFITSAYRTHSKLNKIAGQAMGNLLLQEDWKATFG